MSTETATANRNSTFAFQKWSFNWVLRWSFHLQKKWVKTRVNASRFHSVGDWENIGRTKSSLSQVYAPRFHPANKWGLTVEFKSS